MQLSRRFFLGGVVASSVTSIARQALSFFAGGPQNIFVDAAKAVADPDGSIAKPFATINEALNFASRLSSHVDKTIHLASGRYEAPFSIPRDTTVSVNNYSVAHLQGDTIVAGDRRVPAWAATNGSILNLSGMTLRVSPSQFEATTKAIKAV